ncbi:hypothetical protein IEO70_02765 [Bacillus sp. AGMB 02131]|uniref:Uncharacterized protein n=1 Tax=Peribacillus faecalis TaxID=2772559 RepID=A0A927H9V1_9BACI|nr:hypothetical protein [Peribacillus faecalis]MBD3107274.1 hypothetical protein [Peribacillus faecalis]
MLEAEIGKQLIWVNRSSHLFHPDDAALIEQYLIQFVISVRDLRWQ